MFGRPRIYLDYASAVPVLPRAKAAFIAALTAYGNPSAPHTEGRNARAIVEDARTAVARLAEVKPDAVLFTSGATEANALAIQGVVRASKREHPHVLYLPTAHSSVVETMEALAQEGVAVEPLILSEGMVDLNALEAQLRPETILISLDAVCGETGTSHNTRDVRRVLDKAKSGAFLHVDASQLPRIASFERTRLGADLITLDAQKVGGIRGVGALIALRHVPLAPLVHGGGQERGLRSGSEPSALIAAFAVALLESNTEVKEFLPRAERMRAELLWNIADIKDLVINGGTHTVPHILNISLLGRDTDYLVALLDEAGFAVSTKSACETDLEGSRVVLLETQDPERAAATLRISWGSASTSRQLQQFAKALKDAVAFLDAQNV
ncbi:MAG TPA: aminotransferase class V-fold PLP-dependent enzyme [Candidatus Paceibacterota bacterium]|nr:aminotransferase class V-fold PLP-dependent enzyme [Candidatus Paceibacterota bacterium]